MNAAEMLQNEYQIDSEVWSVTSFSELRKMVWKLKDIIYFIQKRRKKVIYRGVFR